MNQNETEHEHRFYSRSTRILVEIIIFASLATALSLVTFTLLPQGGSVTAASMVPILWLALRRGPAIGLATGALYGVVQLVILPYAYNPLQVLFDYPFAFGCLGLAGFFKKWPVAGAVVGISGRFVLHFVSGVVWFGPMFAPELDPFIYSAVYNASYMLPELVISAVIVYALQKSKALNMYL